QWFAAADALAQVLHLAREIVGRVADDRVQRWIELRDPPLVSSGYFARIDRATVATCGDLRRVEADESGISHGARHSLRDTDPRRVRRLSVAPYRACRREGTRRIRHARESRRHPTRVGRAPAS